MNCLPFDPDPTQLIFVSNSDLTHKEDSPICQHFTFTLLVSSLATRSLSFCTGSWVSIPAGLTKSILPRELLTTYFNLCLE